DRSSISAPRPWKVRASRWARDMCDWMVSCRGWTQGRVVAGAIFAPSPQEPAPTADPNCSSRHPFLERRSCTLPGLGDDEASLTLTTFAGGLQHGLRSAQARLLFEHSQQLRQWVRNGAMPGDDTAREEDHQITRFEIERCRSVVSLGAKS